MKSFEEAKHKEWLEKAKKTVKEAMKRNVLKLVNPYIPIHNIIKMKSCRFFFVWSGRNFVFTFIYLSFTKVYTDPMDKEDADPDTPKESIEDLRTKIYSSTKIITVYLLSKTTADSL